MKARTVLFLMIGIFASEGCCNIRGPFQKRAAEAPVDLPQYSIEEQMRRGRDRYAMPQDDFRTGPFGYNDRPSPTGR